MLPEAMAVDFDTPGGPPRENPPRSVEATRLLAAIVESSDDAIISKSLEGIIQTWNAAAERIFGLTAAEAVGRHISIIIPPDRIAEEQVIMSKLLAGDRIEHFETLRQRSDGRTIAVSLTISPIKDDTGRIVAASKIARDISSRSKAEAALRESEARFRELADQMSQFSVELERTNRRKDEFLATLSHELRTPLAAIRNAQAVLNVAHGEPALAEPALATMNRQIAQMTRLLDDLLDVSRITRDSLQLRQSRVELGAVLADAVETMRPMFERNGLQLTVELPDAPVYVLADAARLAQVFGNLLTNAAKYTPGGGRVSVTTEGEGDQVAVIVTDTGIGIPPEMLTRVFELFTQVGGQHEGEQGGLGIGLSLVRRLVEMHGGTVTAHSEGPGTGSRFAVRLPVLPGVAVSPQPKVASQSTGGTPRMVLVVDDEPDSAVTLAMLLQLRGHRADVAHDGPEALKQAEALEPEVVLLDLGLPGMDGYEVCRRLRELPGGRSMFIVALTGWGQEEDRRRTREAGFDLHLVKPVDPEELLRVLSSTSTSS
jgi:two-component system, chemotaxis family, CheB/CheR fusion protein